MCDVGIYRELARMFRDARQDALEAKNYASAWGIGGFPDLTPLVRELQDLQYRAEEYARKAERLKAESSKP